MALDSLSAINSAYEDGRWHLQRVHKSSWAGVGGAFFGDPTYASGQPGYDAHVGSPGSFVPCVASGNDAVWFPGIDPSHERRLANVTMRSYLSIFGGANNYIIFDLLGFYPLLDGDSTEEQTLDNTLTLPRYASGDGVIAVLVNHVAPALAQGTVVVNATDSDGVDQVSTCNVPLNGIGTVCSAASNSAAAGPGPVAMSIGCPRGVKRINSVQFTAAPGGLFALYLLRPLMTLLSGDHMVAVEKECLSHHAMHCPRIYDGAWLGWFMRQATNSTSTSTAMFWGHFTFIWG